MLPACALRHALLLFAFLGPMSVDLYSARAEGPEQSIGEPAAPAAKGESGQRDASEPITDADRIARLTATVEDDEKALKEQRSQLEKRRSEEDSAGSELQKINDEIKSQTTRLQKAQDAGDASIVNQTQERLQSLEKRRELTKEQFDLAVQARKTTQEQVATLEEKTRQDKQALAELRGLAAPPTEAAPESEPTAPVASPAPPALPPGILPATGSGEAAQPNAPPAKKAPPTIAERAARQKVEQKEEDLAGLERDLENVANSKALLEKDIELESQTLKTARKQYDNLEKEIAATEEHFHERLAAGAAGNELDKLRQHGQQLQQQLRESQNTIRTSTDRLQDLHKQRSALQNEEAALLKQTGTLKRQTEAAKIREFFVRAKQYLVDTVPVLLAILLAMLVLWAIIRLIGGRVQKWIERDAVGTKAERRYRSTTLIGVVQNTANAVVAVGGVLIMLDAAGASITLLLGGAGVAGLAIAFAAQSLIKDYFCGFLLLLENQFKLGDVITVDGMTGSVERMTLRITVLRNLDGHVFYVPNGQITIVKNQTAGWARVLLDVGVAYKEQVDHVVDVLMQVAGELRADPDYSDFVLSAPEMFGVDALADSSVVVRLGLKVRAEKQWAVKRELLRRIKQRFDEVGIEIPFPQRTVHHRLEGDGAPLVIGQANGLKKN